MNTTYANEPSEKQVDLIERLLVERDYNEPVDWENLTGGRGGSASALIDKLFATPKRLGKVVPEGMHRLDDGRIFKVQIAHHGSGNPYAKQLIVRELADGTRTADFVYAPGAVKLLSTDTRMTFDEAREFGALYGVCVKCGATLTDEDSIRLGIGPVCGQRVYQWETGVSLTRSQMILLGKLEEGPQKLTGAALRTGKALHDAGLAKLRGSTLRKIEVAK